MGTHFFDGRPSEHGGYDPGAEHLIDGCIGITRVADIGSPVEDIFKNFVFVRRMCVSIIGNQFLKVGDRFGKAGKGRSASLCGH